MPEELIGRQAMPVMRRGVTLRAVAIGVGLTLVFAWVLPYNSLYLRAKGLEAGFLPAAAVFVLAIISLVVNPLLKKLFPGEELSGSELVLIWVMTVVGAAAAHLSLTGIIPSVVGGVFNYANPGNQWEERFLHFIPSKLTPSTDPTARVITAYFQGLEPGEKIEWGLWVRPLMYWGLLLVLLYLFFFSLADLLRRQWVDRERLPFPLLRLPVEMVREAERGKLLNSFFSNKLMWLGFGVAAFITGVNEYVLQFSGGKTIPLRFPMFQQMSQAPWSLLHVNTLEVSLTGLGIVYILPVQVAFSLWFFFAFTRFELLMKGVVGYPRSSPREPFMIYQEAGVIVCFAVFTLWLARPHLKEVVRKAIFGKGTDDSEEAFSYRVAFFGVLGSILGIALWCRFVANISFLVSFIFVLLFATLCFVLTKVVAQGGMTGLAKGFQPDMLMTSFVRPGVIGAQALTMVLVLEWTLIAGLQRSVLPDAMHAFKLSDSARVRRRAIFGAILLVLLLGAALSFYSHSKLVYQEGAGHLGGRGGISRAPKRAAQEIIRYADQIGKGEATDFWWSHVIFFFVGAGLMFVVYYFQSRLFWWPFHPIGLIAADMNTMAVPGGWFTIFLGWLVKRTVLGVGGGRAYKRLLPVFLGLIMGEAFVRITLSAILFIMNKPSATA